MKSQQNTTKQPNLWRLACAEQATMESMESRWMRLLKKTGFIGSPATRVLIIGAGVLGAVAFFLPRLGLVFGAGLAFVGGAIFILSREDAQTEEDASDAEEKDWLETHASDPNTGMALFLLAGTFLLASLWPLFALFAGVAAILLGICSFKLSLREEELQRQKEQGRDTEQ